jgi:hypothetical protein
MRLSSKFAAQSAVAILSTMLLCGASSPAASQTATGSAASLPSITVEGTRHVAGTHRPRQAGNGAASRRIASTAQSPTARTPSAAPDTVLGRLAKLERASSSCNGGCETSVRHGDTPWVGCSNSGGENSVGAFSAACRDTLTYRTYAECVSTKIFIGWIPREARWHCSGLQVAGKLAGEKQQVAELKSGRR